MKRRLSSMHLSSKGARAHFAVAVALISVIPCLTLFYLYSAADGFHPLTLAQWCIAGLGIAGAMVFGYVLLGKYPATIVRLRACLQDVVAGDLTNSVDLSSCEQDVAAIEDALNAVLAQLRGKLDETQALNVRLEDELFQTQKLEAIGTLAAGIAHEINTPLQFVSNNLQFIGKACREILAEPEQRRKEVAGVGKDVPREGNQEHERREFFQAELPRAFKQLEEGVARIAQIVKAVRDFAKGEDDSVKSPLDLNRAIETTIEVTRNEWKYDAELEAALEPTLPSVTCFPGEIKRTVMELVLNARQAVAAGCEKDGRGRGRIRIVTRRDEGNVLLSVSDNGCGIPADIRDRIFDPFFTTREVGAGKGCGLAFVHSAVVSRHGGALTFVTEEDKGTTFTVSIPITGRARTPGAARQPEFAGECVQGEIV